MSYASTYEYQPPRSKGIGMALAVHGAIIAAVMMMPGIEIPDRITRVVIGENIPAPPEEKPIVEPIEPIVEPPVKVEQQAPLPPVPPAPETIDRSPTEFASAGISGLTGGSAINIQVPPVEPIKPIAEPVIVRAGLDQRYARKFQPPYPPGQLRMEQEGLVSVRVLVGVDGRVKDIQLVDSPHGNFWRATRRHAIRNWRFTPATRDGVPFESWMDVKVRFEING